MRSLDLLVCKKGDPMNEQDEKDFEEISKQKIQAGYHVDPSCKFWFCEARRTLRESYSDLLVKADNFIRIFYQPSRSIDERFEAAHQLDMVIKVLKEKGGTNG